MLDRAVTESPITEAVHSRPAYQGWKPSAHSPFSSIIPTTLERIAAMVSSDLQQRPGGDH